MSDDRLTRRQLLAGLGAIGVGGAAAVAAAVRAQRPSLDATTPSPQPTTSSPSASPSPTSQASPPAAAPSEPATDEVSPAQSPQPSASPTPIVVPMLCRDAWGAVAARPTDARHEPVRLTLHHTGVVLGDNRRAPSRLRQHQRFHLDNGFSDIAYHVGIDRNGHVYELRDPAVPGETFTNYDPAGHYLLLAEGDFGREQPSDAQLEGIAQVMAAVSSGRGIAVDTLTGHRDHDASTPCPGDALYARLDDLQRRAVELTRTDRRLVRWCGAEADDHVAAIEAGQV